jgi:hypothetical protein
MARDTIFKILMTPIAIVIGIGYGLVCCAIVILPSIWLLEVLGFIR